MKEDCIGSQGLPQQTATLQEEEEEEEV